MEAAWIRRHPFASTLVVLFSVPPIGYSVVAHCWKAALEARARSVDANALLFACRNLMSEVRLAQPFQSSQGPTVIRAGGPHEKLLPAAILETKPVLVIVTDWRVSIALSKLVPLSLEAFPEGEEGMGSERLTSGLWLRR